MCVGVWVCVLALQIPKCVSLFSKTASHPPMPEVNFHSNLNIELCLMYSSCCSITSKLSSTRNAETGFFFLGISLRTIKCFGKKKIFMSLPVNWRTKEIKWFVFLLKTLKCFQTANIFQVSSPLPQWFGFV